MSSIFDSYYIQPVARIKENISIWTLGKWEHYIIEYQNEIAPGPASTVDMLVQAGVTVLAANATLAKRVVTILQLNDLEFLHVRWEPIDNVEGLIWEQSGQQMNSARNIHSRVDFLTRNRDPHLATTTFFILGQNRDMNLEVRNPMRYPIAAARFVFWGNRMILSPLDIDAAIAKAPTPTPTPLTKADIAATKALLSKGDMATIRRIIGSTTFVPAEGRQA